MSEMGLLRPAITLFLVWFGLIAYRLRQPAPTAGVGGAIGAVSYDDVKSDLPQSS
jgi:hypothetical protein